MHSCDGRRSQQTSFVRTHLKLRHCKLTGDVAPLQGLTQLKDLDLYGCKGLTGDKGALMRGIHARGGVCW